MIESVCEAVQAGRIRYYGVYPGVVVDNADPTGDHRVRVRIDGLLDPSAWARPLTAGGGSKERGGHLVPAVGADVYVQFVGGDVERPIYSGGHWSSKATAGDERSLEAREAGSEAHRVQTLELDDIRITVDERDGKRAVCLRNKKTNDEITIDIKAGGLKVRMTSAILLEAIGLISLDAAQVTINGRNVMPDSKAIL